MIQSELLYISLKTAFLAETGGRFPNFTGSMLRGAFGYALKKSFCSVWHQQCSDCPISRECGYFFIFETVSETDKQNGLFYKPHPYILSVPDGGSFSKGDLLIFDIILLGKSVHWIPHIMAALQIMGSLGFGSDRHNFNLHSVTDVTSDKPVWSADPESETEVNIYNLRTVVNGENFNPQTILYNLDFLNVARITHQGKDIRKLDGPILSKAVISRFKNLHQLYGNLAEADLQNLPALKIISQTAKPRTARRFSSRQNRTVELRGVQGTFLLEITDPRWFYLLKSMEILNIGKNSSFGLGRIKLRAANEI